jgi:hypothetical protein
MYSIKYKCICKLESEERDVRTRGVGEGNLQMVHPAVCAICAITASTNARQNTTVFYYIVGTEEHRLIANTRNYIISG